MTSTQTSRNGRHRRRRIPQHIRARIAAGAAGVVALATVGAGLSIALGGHNPPGTSPAALAATAAQPDAPLTARVVLASLPVRDLDRTVDYQRDDQFGSDWGDPDRNGCDARQDAVARQMVHGADGSEPAGTTRDRRGCVTSTTVLDPYTGAALPSSRAQGDHVVALSNAARTGAERLTSDQRRLLANDAANVIMTTADQNQRAKSDRAADAYLPPSTAFQCRYVALQLDIKRRYALWATPAERDRMAQVIQTCPNETVPGGPRVAYY